MSRSGCSGSLPIIPTFGVPLGVRVGRTVLQVLGRLLRVHECNEKRYKALLLWMSLGSSSIPGPAARPPTSAAAGEQS